MKNDLENIKEIIRLLKKRFMKKLKRSFLFDKDKRKHVIFESLGALLAGILLAGILLFPPFLKEKSRENQTPVTPTPSVMMEDVEVTGTPLDEVFSLQESKIAETEAPVTITGDERFDIIGIDIDGNVAKEIVYVAKKTQPVEVNEDIMVVEVEEEVEEETHLLGIEEEEELTKIYDVPLSAEIQWYIYELCEAKGVPFEVALATIYVESNYNPDCVSYNEGSQSVDKGLFQINSCNYEWFTELFGTFDPLDIYDSCKAGIHFIQYSMTFDSHPHVYMMVYNMGESGARKLWKQDIYSTAYSRKLCKYMNEVLPKLKLTE